MELITVETWQAQSEREAWMAFFVVAINADGKPTNIEMAAFAQATHILSVFEYTHDTKTPLLYEITTLRIKLGSKALIDGSLYLIEINSRDTLFTLCADIMLSNGKMNETKQNVMKEIATALQLNEVECQKIIEVLLIKNKRNYRNVRSLG